MKVDIPRNHRVRPRIVIHAHDTWSMDHTLAMIILPMLKQIKADAPGTPGIIFPADYRDLLEEDQEKAEKEAQAKWLEILDKMIWSMEQIKKGADGPKLPIPVAQKGMSQKQRMERWMETIPCTRADGSVIEGMCQQKYQDEYDEVEIAQWRKDHAEYHAKVQEGCELFGKYFQSLWT